MLNPRSALSMSSPQQKEMAAGLRVEAWVPVAIASLIVASGQGAPTSTGQPYVAYSWSSAVTAWGVPARGEDRVGCCFLRKNVSRQGARCISAAVAMAREKRGSFGGAVAACAESGGAVPGSTQGEKGQGTFAAFEARLVATSADGARTALPSSMQGETRQGAAAASEAGLVAAAAEGAGTALPGSTQGETGQGAAAASEAGIVAAAAEVAGTASRTS